MPDTVQSVEDGNQQLAAIDELAKLDLIPLNETWFVEPKPVLDELTPEFGHADYTPQPSVKERLLQVALKDRIDDTMRNRLTELGYL